MTETTTAAISSLGQGIVMQYRWFIIGIVAALIVFNAIRLSVKDKQEKEAAMEELNDRLPK